VVAVCALHRAAARARRSGQASTHVVRADPGALLGRDSSLRTFNVAGVAVRAKIGHGFV
jgi:hypothetical protein